VLVLNKCDRIAPDELLELERVLRSLQPKAKFIRSVMGEVAPAEILNTNLFNFEEASTSAGWIREMEKAEHTPETDEYGISSFVYERALPFEPRRLKSWMEDWPAEIVRAKGIMWLATRNKFAQNLSQAGPSIRFGPAGYWVAALPETEQQAILAEEGDSIPHWDPVYGDRINKVVFIGLDLDQEEIVRSLDACLLTEEEMQSDWSRFADELPNLVGELNEATF